MAMSKNRRLNSEQQLEAEMLALLCNAEILDAQEHGKYGKDEPGDELPEELQRRTRRLEWIHKAKAELQAEAAAAKTRQREDQADLAEQEAAEAEVSGDARASKGAALRARFARKRADDAQTLATRESEAAGLEAPPRSGPAGALPSQWLCCPSRALVRTPHSCALLLTLAVAVAGCQSETPPQAKAVAVAVEPARSIRFAEEISTISTLEAPEEVNLAAQAGGRIESLRVRQGDAVRQGQLLVVLDQTQLSEEVRALAGQREESRLNAQRFEFLVKQGAASPIQRDALRQNLLAADSALRAKQADLAYKDLRAPIDGVVSDVTVKPGDVIRAGTPFTTIQRTARLLARVEVPARFGQRVRPGQPVLLDAPAASRPVQGRVVSIDPRVNNATQAFLVKAELDNPSGRVP